MLSLAVRTDSLTRIVAAGVFMAGVIFIATGSAAGWDFTTDDAYITLRYSQNLYFGNGIVWNPGESPAVEGYSNYTFVLLGALSLALGVDPAFTLKWAGILGLLMGYVATWFIVRTFVKNAIVAAIPGLFIVSYIGIPYWSVIGLETGMYLGLTLSALAFWCWSAYPPIPLQKSRASFLELPTR